MKAFLIFIEMKATDFRIFYKLLTTVQTHVLINKRDKKSADTVSKKSEKAEIKNKNSEE